MSNSLWPHGLQHARLLCPPLSPRVCSDSCPLSWRCYLTISFSAAPLLLLPSIFPSIRVFSSESALYTRWPALASVLSMNIQGWFSLGLTGLISLLSRRLSPTQQFESINSLAFSLLYGPTLTSVRDYWKSIALTRWTFVSKVMSLLFNTLSRFVIAILPRSKYLLILWLQSPSIVILEPKKIKSVTVSTFPHQCAMKNHFLNKPSLCKPSSQALLSGDLGWTRLVNIYAQKYAPTYTNASPGAETLYNTDPLFNWLLAWNAVPHIN